MNNENIGRNLDVLAEHPLTEISPKELEAQSYSLCKELIEKAKLQKGQILVVGCSSSEVIGERIGSCSSLEAAECLFQGIYRACLEAEVFLATQCCEHLNRALVVERAALPFPEPVNVVPKPKAGGSFSTKAYENFRDPILVERIQADAGLDIGDTFIGMHLKSVAVPLRLSQKELLHAHVTAARVRPKFIGGIRASYDERLL